jgi:hypothetical protein
MNDACSVYPRSSQRNAASSSPRLYPQRRIRGRESSVGAGLEVFGRPFGEAGRRKQSRCATSDSSRRRGANPRHVGGGKARRELGDGISADDAARLSTISTADSYLTNRRRSGRTIYWGTNAGAVAFGRRHRSLHVRGPPLSTVTHQWPSTACRRPTVMPRTA